MNAGRTEVRPPVSSMLECAMNGSVALVTGAGGEMGRLLHSRFDPAGASSRRRSIWPRCSPELAKAREWSGHGADQHPRHRSACMRVLMRSHRPGFVFHLAAMLSAHAERDPELAHQGQRRGTLSLFSLCRQRARAGALSVPQQHRRLRAARRRRPRPTRARSRNGSGHPDQDVRLQQALLRAGRNLPGATLGRGRGRRLRLPLHPLSRSDQRRDAALGRHHATSLRR